MAGFKETETASALTVFGDVAQKWLKLTSVIAMRWFGAGALNIPDLVKNIATAVKKKVKNLWEKIRGFWDKNKKGILIGVGIGILVVSGGFVLGGVIGGIGALIGTLGTVGAGLIGAAAVGVLPGLVNRMVSAVQYLYHFNWQQSDKDINAEIEGALVGLYGVAGDALGVAMAGLLTGGLKGGFPKPEIRMGAIVSLWQTVEEDVQEEILENLTALAMAGIRTFGAILFKKVYMNARKWLKSNFRTGIPNVDKAIASWGNEGNKPWSMALYVEEKIESIPDKRIEAFAEGFTESFFESSGEFIRLQWGR